MMRPRSFLFQFAILAIGFALINVAVQRATRNAPAHALVRNIDRSYKMPISDLALGNSTMVGGFDAHAFDAALDGRRVFKLSLGSTKPIQHYATLRYYYDHLAAGTPAPRTLIYGFFDRQLTDTTELPWDDVMGNKALVYFADIRTTLPFYAASQGQWQAMRYRLSAPFPVVSNRGQIWGKVEKLRRTVGEIGLPHQATNEFGRVEDMAALETDPTQFQRECARDARAGTPFSPTVDAMMKLCARHDTQVVLVSMPLPARHRQTYYSTETWKQYQARLRETARRYNARYVDASQWIDDADFRDHVHLSKMGGTKFTRRLAMSPAIALAP